MRRGDAASAAALLRRLRRLGLLAWVAILAAALGGGALSLALFSDQQPVQGLFTVGTVSLGLTPSTALVTMTGMVPGSEVDGVLTIQNAGSLDLRYAMTSSVTDADGKHLRDVLHFDIERRTACGGSVLETLYSGPIATVAFGDPQVGPDAGDRPLGAGASEVLCFRASLPAGTDTLYVSATTTATLTFWAEQTAGNP
jgi:hypothetical protein